MSDSIGRPMDIPCKEQFPRAGAVAYLDTAAEGLPPESAFSALTAYYGDKASGSPGRRRMFEAQRDATAGAARLLETDPDNITLLANASDGFTVLGNSIYWQSGDEVLITDLEFRSNVVSWLRLQYRGVRMQVIGAHDGVLDLDQFTRRIGPRTKLVSVSLVSYKNGGRIPFMRELAPAVHDAGAIFCVDATQALGRVPVSVAGLHFLVASTYKWLLGVHGLGVVYCAPALREQLLPGAAGWYSVRDLFAPDRFERFALKDGASRFPSGMPNFPSIYVLRETIGFLLDVGIERLDASLAPLVERLRTGIAELNLSLLTPWAPGYSSGIVAFEHPEAVELGRRLSEQDVVVWAGDGRVRTSVHLYNDRDDIDRRLASLEKALLQAASAVPAPLNQPNRSDGLHYRWGSRC